MGRHCSTAGRGHPHAHPTLIPTLTPAAPCLCAWLSRPCHQGMSSQGPPPCSAGGAGAGQGPRGAEQAQHQLPAALPARLGAGHSPEPLPAEPPSCCPAPPVQEPQSRHRPGLLETASCFLQAPGELSLQSIAPARPGRCQPTCCPAGPWEPRHQQGPCPGLHGGHTAAGPAAPPALLRSEQRPAHALCTRQHPAASAQPCRSSSLSEIYLRTQD